MLINITIKTYLTSIITLKHLNFANMIFFNPENGTKHVTRSCSKIGSTSNDCTIDGQAPEHCYFCYKDLCNGSSPVGVTNMWMTLIPAIVTVALIKYLF